MTLTLLTPLRGWVGPLDEMPDPVFAQRMLGDGVAIDPTGSTLHAPCDAEVISVARTSHAVTLRAANGAEILMHVGLETVAMDGEGFTAHVRAGDRVKAGDRLIAFDIDLLARRVRSLLTPVLVTNPEAFAIAWRAGGRESDVGERLIELRPVNADSAGEAAKGEALRRRVTLGLPHGLHARPAGKAVALIKPFDAEVSLQAHGRSANAKSPVALMTLGAACGDEVTLIGRGADAEAALEALAAFLAGDGGETAAATCDREAAPPPDARPVDGILRGVPAALGHAIGRAVQARRVEIRIEAVGVGMVQERTRLAAALNIVRKRIESAATGGAAGEDIMAAHLALLDDPDLNAQADALITAGQSAGYAWSRPLDAQADALRRLDDPRLRARAADLVDLKRQVLRALSDDLEPAQDLPVDAILLADDLLPSELMALKGRILGLCTAGGGPTAHVAIIAAALNIPMVAAAGPAVLEVADGTPVILDADAGTLAIDPKADDLSDARDLARRRAALRTAAIAHSTEACRMADGTRIEVFANLATVGDAALAVAHGAEGCGLLRSEFLFMDRAAPPDEEEQRTAYQAIADGLDGRPLIIRTLDIGGDKPVAYLSLPKEENPALGLRGVRTSLWRPDLLRTQLRAILRVDPPGAVKIMIPMVASLDELTAVRAVLEHERAALNITTPLELGVMIETPAAAVTASALATAADFFSIGSNDLTQYALAMDRTNPAVAAQVDALHPAVLRLMAMTCDGARAERRPVGLCGGLASDPLAAPLLIGLGVTELSATPSVIPELKAAIRPLRMEACRALATACLALTSAAAVRARLAEAWAARGEADQ